MTDLDLIIKWVNEINTDIERLKKKIEKIGNTVLNTRYNSHLFSKINKFGIHDSGVCRLEGNNVVYRWTSYLNGIWKEHIDIELVGEVKEKLSLKEKFDKAKEFIHWYLNRH